MPSIIWTSARILLIGSSGTNFSEILIEIHTFYASAFRRRRHYVFGLYVRPKPEIPSFDLYMGPLVHLTNRNRFTACPSVRPLSVRPERFPGICRIMHGGIGLKFYMLMYLHYLQNWLVFGRGLLIFIRPFEKWTYYAVAMSVRPRFPDFSSTCFKISIWNLVYTFSRWHDMSS